VLSSRISQSTTMQGPVWRRNKPCDALRRFRQLFLAEDIVVLSTEGMYSLALTSTNIWWVNFSCSVCY